MEEMIGEHGGVIISGIIAVIVIVAMAVVIASARGISFAAILSVAGE